jgi:glycosyltransferase involved in cell wall biosynthesis
LIIHLDNVDLNSRTGPNSFASRFVSEVTRLGHSVTSDGRNADVSLVFIERTGAPIAKKFVQRLDGIWFSPNQFHTMNAGIKRTYESADHVVWQSEFDMKMTSKWWSSPKQGSVIRNGAPKIKLFNEEIAKSLRLLKAKHEKIFVCSSNWHPQKRLKDNIRLFKHLKKFYPTSCLIVMGNNPSHQKEEDIYLTGSLPHDACMQIFKGCDWMLHLAWLDHCPNTVIEALSCGTPVICTEDGGTTEIVSKYGLILKEKSPYQFQLTDYDSPPELDVQQISNQLPSPDQLEKPIDLSIEKSVAEYMSVFTNILGETIDVRK